jgi:hypothetical protein
MKALIRITIFSIAMGFMETAVVIYLRRIYYPDGFRFPLVVIDDQIAVVELCREAATIIMLVLIGILTGKTTSQRFSVFIYCFAVWDIFYYIFLKVFLDWPASLVSWDILFLIPVPWLGPVLAPVILSVSMILLAAPVIYSMEKGINAEIKKREWICLIAGSVTVILSFIWNYILIISSQENTSNTDADIMLSTLKHYVPEKFNWIIFSVGELIIVAGVFLFLRRVFRGVKIRSNEYKLN